LADGTTEVSAHDALGDLQPQWSPSLADGTTAKAAPGPDWSADAAMEPVLGGRDDHSPIRWRWETISAAMEPVLGGRDDLQPFI